MMFAKKMNSLAEAVKYVQEKYNDYSTVIMPQGGLTVPIMQDNKNSC